MEYIKLIGIVIIVVGFALKLDVLAVVIVSGIVTGISIWNRFYRSVKNIRRIFC